MEKEIPEFLYKELLDTYGKENVNKIIAGYFEENPVTIRVNTLKTNVDNIKNELSKEKITFKTVGWYKDALIIENAKEDKITNLNMYKNGEIYMQSLSSMIPAIIMNPKKDENILDMTAAPGGKTTQMAALSNNESMITACEKNKIRLERLKYNLDKQGAKRVNVMMEDARKLDNFFAFDKILLDAPCSGSGTKNVLKKDFSEELINRLEKTEEELLKKALTILKRENENILNKVLPKFNAEIIPIEDENLKEIQLLPVTIDGVICIMPSKFYEGFFIAKIKKN